jgi:hypothetical protein
MTILHGVVVGAGALGIMRVRLKGRGVINILPINGVGIGDRLVLIWDTIRSAVSETYTLEEWERYQTDEIAEEPPGKDEEVEESEFDPEIDDPLLAECGLCGEE